MRRAEAEKRTRRRRPLDGEREQGIPGKDEGKTSEEGGGGKVERYKDRIDNKGVGRDGKGKRKVKSRWWNMRRICVEAAKRE